MDEFRGARVLVVDDDRLIREMTGDALGDEGFAVSLAPAASDALEALAGPDPFAVVITDLSMRGMDGLQLLEQIKRDQPKTDVIILTGYASLESALQAMRLGAADYLRKPVKPPEIVYAVHQVLLRRRILTENENLRSCLQSFEASRVLAGCLETPDVLPLTIDILLRTLGRRRAVGRLTSLLPRPADGIVLSGFSPNLEAAVREQIELGKIFDPSVLESAAEGGRAEPRRRELSAELSRLLQADETLLELPLRHAGEVAGAIWLLADREPFTDEELRCAGVITAQAELALVNAERFLQARERAFVDDVTELYNARYLLAALDREVNRAERSKSPLSVLFLDLDRFKLVNDSHGHLVGSRVLRELGEHLLSCIRSIDTLARYGGDEFTVVLVDTDVERAMEVAERIRDRVARASFGGERDLRLTVSVGVASFGRHGTTREALLDAADKAMYMGKAMGRDHVCSADRLGSEGDP